MSVAIPLTFYALREANIKRLPQFKNAHGQAAHSKPDGSDWSPAQWLQALVGEVGEWAQVRLDYEAGQLTAEQYQIKSAKELADIQTYLDLLAMRSLDVLVQFPYDASVRDGDTEQRMAQGHPFVYSIAQMTMRVVAALGDFANTRKKYDRGEFSFAVYQRLAHTQLSRLNHELIQLIREAMTMDTGVQNVLDSASPDYVHQPHPTGVYLGEATKEKFNEVSKRVGCEVWL